ncbi:hypothetical protein PHYBOEH_004828 [Phytophthora boehmeriae]|uniref:RxLR effector protein n=1 Tax=Phytophthora boehmeriae TaxID=109152 RepID=A0A8T1WKU4_9STRA|nr:hypothetical protein PHYBOEH_004828 [Phytophthora boehmeriae]
MKSMALYYALMTALALFSISNAFFLVAGFEQPKTVKMIQPGKQLAADHHDDTEKRFLRIEGFEGANSDSEPADEERGILSDLKQILRWASGRTSEEADQMKLKLFNQFKDANPGNAASNMHYDEFEKMYLQIKYGLNPVGALDKFKIANARTAEASPNYPQYQAFLKVYEFLTGKSA